MISFLIRNICSHFAQCVRSGSNMLFVMRLWFLTDELRLNVDRRVHSHRFHLICIHGNSVGFATGGAELPRMTANTLRRKNLTDSQRPKIAASAVSVLHTSSSIAMVHRIFNKCRALPAIHACDYVNKFIKQLLFFGTFRLQTFVYWRFALPSVNIQFHV